MIGMNFEDVKPYTQEELNQQSVWAEQFEKWWEDEGQYQRAGGGDYEKTFAWWAWLNREQSKEAAIQEMDEVIKLQDADLRKYEKRIEGLKEQLNNMEACYIEKKKEAEDQQGRVSRALNFINNWWHPDLDQKLFVEAVANALRGES